MVALAFTPWFVLLLQVLAALLTIFLGWKVFVRLRQIAKEQRCDLVETIDLLLPQTQCGQCGYAGCTPYAEAIAAGDTINKCPPGGDRTIHRLANLLNKPSVALNPEHGEFAAPSIAYIREPECIGCTKCIQACPVDAIVGAAKLMHTVIASECTGCDLCVAPCPVDCIDMLPEAEQIPAHWEFPGQGNGNSTGSVFQ